MSAADRFAEFRQERESADKEQTSRSSTNRPVNFGDYETSLTRTELLQKHELEHEFKNKNGESIFELQRCPRTNNTPREGLCPGNLCWRRLQVANTTPVNGGSLFLRN